MFSWLKKKSAAPVPLRTYVQIRLEAIGGQGANSAGKILAEAAVLGLGFNGQHFSTYGSEKRGSPVKSHVRFRSDQIPLRSSAPISDPDLLVVFSEALLLHHPEVLSGLNEHSVLIVNAAKHPQSLRFPPQTKLQTVATIDATKIAAEFRCLVNAPMLGAISVFLPEISRDVLLRTFENFFARLRPEQLEANARGFTAGESAAEKMVFASWQKIPLDENKKQESFGWSNAPIGGAIVNPGNSTFKDLSASRRAMIPALDLTACIHCGNCDMVCPDFCFVWEFPIHPETKKQELPQLLGIDYQYCKGCEKCVSVCPVGALSTTDDNEETIAKIEVKKLP